MEERFSVTPPFVKQLGVFFAQGKVCEVLKAEKNEVKRKKANEFGQMLS